MGEEPDQNFDTFMYILNYTKDNDLLKQPQSQEILKIINQVEKDPTTSTFSELKKFNEMKNAVLLPDPTLGDLKSHIKNQEKVLDLEGKGRFYVACAHLLAWLQGDARRTNRIKELRNFKTIA